MKKVIFFHIFLFAAAAVLTAQAGRSESFDEIVDFSVTMSTVQEYYSQGNSDRLTDKVVILDGAVSSILILDENPDSFFAELVIVNGEWHGTEEVEMYSCILHLRGKQYADRLPARRRRREDGPDNLIESNSRILAAGRITGAKESLFGTATAVVDTLYIRNID